MREGHQGPEESALTKDYTIQQNQWVKSLSLSHAEEAHIKHETVFGRDVRERKEGERCSEGQRDYWWPGTKMRLSRWSQARNRRTEQLDESIVAAAAVVSPFNCLLLKIVQWWLKKGRGGRLAYDWCPCSRLCSLMVSIHSIQTWVLSKILLVPRSKRILVPSCMSKTSWSTAPLLRDGSNDMLCPTTGRSATNSKNRKEGKIPESLTKGCRVVQESWSPTIWNKSQKAVSC